MADYTAHNSKVFKARLKNFTEREIKTPLVAMLREVAQGIVNAIDEAFGSFNPPKVPFAGNSQFPVWYGQLHDATGVGVYVNGALSQFLPTKKALDSQTQSHNGVTGIIGSESLRLALSEASATFSKGIWIVLFSAVPYAYKVNEQGSPWGRGVGFFGRIKSLLIDDVFSGLRPISDFHNPNSLGL